MCIFSVKLCISHYILSRNQHYTFNCDNNKVMPEQTSLNFLTNDCVRPGTCARSSICGRNSHQYHQLYTQSKLRLLKTLISVVKQYTDVAQVDCSSQICSCWRRNYATFKLNDKVVTHVLHRHTDGGSTRVAGATAACKKAPFCQCRFIVIKVQFCMKNHLVSQERTCSV